MNINTNNRATIENQTTVDTNEIKKFYDLKDELIPSIYKKIEYDKSKMKPIIKITPTMISIKFLIMNNGFVDSYGYNLYPDRETDNKIYDLDEEMIIERINNVIEKLNEINNENILEVKK